MNELSASLTVSAEAAARRLLGATLTRTFGTRTSIVRIVETEAYDQTDEASHSYRGPSKRTAVMFGPAGYLYVYFIYGKHYCCNVVTGSIGQGAAVLIRAVEIVEGRSLMQAFRPGKQGTMLTNGPAKLCQALDIQGSMNGHDLSKSPLRLELRELLPGERIVVTSRVGLGRAVDTPWRFYIADNKYVSRM